tara:strand:- start:270 stop:965 length:696 start_codon:yes stop_codon:yes gene_type:complete
MRFETIPYNQVIASAKLFLNLENSTDHDGFLLLMADEAMRQINDLTMFEMRTENIPLDGGTAPLPCGFMQAMGLWYTGVNGKCTPAPYVSRNIVNYCDCDTTGCPSLGTSYQINGNHLVFHHPEAITATEVSIAFMGTILDNNNQPQMYERHERCVRAYLSWRYNDKLSKAQDKPNLRQAMKADAREAHREFINQKKYLQGKAVVEQWKEDKLNISRTFNAWIGTEGTSVR